MTQQMNASQVISNIYLAHKIRETADQMIASNEDLADANGRYARGLNYLTGALVVVVVLDVALRYWGPG